MRDVPLHFDAPNKLRGSPQASLSWSAATTQCSNATFKPRKPRPSLKVWGLFAGRHAGGQVVDSTNAEAEHPHYIPLDVDK